MRQLEHHGTQVITRSWRASGDCSSASSSFGGNKRRDVSRSDSSVSAAENHLSRQNAPYLDKGSKYGTNTTGKAWHTPTGHRPWQLPPLLLHSDTEASAERGRIRPFGHAFARRRFAAHRRMHAEDVHDFPTHFPTAGGTDVPTTHRPSMPYARQHMLSITRKDPSAPGTPGQG